MITSLFAVWLILGLALSMGVLIFNETIPDWQGFVYGYGLAAITITIFSTAVFILFTLVTTIVRLFI
jgi:hypothetical protein